MAGSGKGDPRAAAERIECGIELYGEGELAAAAIEFEEALKSCPGHERARQYLGWVRDVLAGKRGVNGRRVPSIDEDALRAVAEALDLEEPPPAAARAPSVDDAAWEPAPPSRPQGVVQPRPEAIAAVATPHGAPTRPIPSPTAPKRFSSQTILGIAPAVLPPIVRPESHWARGTPTGENLPPLEVPELTEEQIAELISLESMPPIAAEEPEPEARQVIEFEAEPTQTPRRAPAELRTHAPTETQPITSRKREDTTPDLIMLPPPPADPVRLEPLDAGPARAHAATIPSSPPPAEPFAELTPPPPLPPLPNPTALDERRDDEMSFDPTNPLFKSKLRVVSHDGDEPEIDLPRAPDASPPGSIAERFETARRALSDGNIDLALETVESLLVEVGGIEADVCLPHLSLLADVYEQVVGPFDHVPQHGEGRPDLDPRAAFLLSRVDGQMSVDDLLEVSGMARLEALRMLALLIQYGAVVMD